MKCPYCANLEDKVVDSRPQEDGNIIKRRRECTACSRRFTTYEKIESMPLVVIKKDGSSQAFDRDKLIKGIMKSCEKRPVTFPQIEALVDRIESEAILKSREIKAVEIGEKVLSLLQDLDQVASIRFASVYREFEDVESFLQELEAIKAKEDHA